MAVNNTVLLKANRQATGTSHFHVAETEQLYIELTAYTNSRHV